MKQSLSSHRHSGVRAPNGNGGKVFVFIFGVFVGTIVASLVIVNFYAGISMQESMLLEYQHGGLDQHRGHQRRHPQKQQLRDVKSSSSKIRDEVPVEILCNEESTNKNTSAEILKTSTSSSSLSALSAENGVNESSRFRCDKEEPNFYELARETGTDKVKGLSYLPSCLEDDSKCTRPSCEREECRPWGHFYHTMYQQKLSKFLNPNESFQLLEIGYNLGFGYDTYKKFFEGVPKAELHTIEISCIEEGPREEGKWPWGNFAKENKEYESLLDRKLLHCGDASDVDWLYQIWNEHMYRGEESPNGSTSAQSPPLKIVIDDGSHLAKHMVYSFFFWFPRIEPGGILIIEDVQPIDEANLFRTQFLPQLMADLHFCGDPGQKKDEACFPQLYPLLQSIHCEMHICVFERNNSPAQPNLSIESSKPPPNALDMNQCYTFSNVFGDGMEAV